MSKQVFPCGHRGKGKFCHRCAQEQKPPEEPEVCKECGRWIGNCGCSELFNGMTVSEFRERQDRVFKESIERIKKDLG